ncbi:cytochrome P450 [Lyophyllum atratum]|nr:cytochrome P450 [Lyophyllum atratum]
MTMKSLIAVTVPVLALYLVLRFRSSRRRLPLPPGPQGWPIIGNLSDMPRETTWLTFAEWGKTYGAISSVTVFGQPIIILNTVDAALEMLSGKGHIYSDRPTLPMGGELIGWKNTLPLVRYGDTFHRYRKLFHQSFGTPSAMKTFHEFEATAVRKFLRNILTSPKDLTTHLKTHIGTVSLGIVYGYDVTGSHDPFIHLVDQGMKQFAIATAPGAFLIDLLPALRHLPPWFPGAGFHAKAKVWAENLYDMGTVPYEHAKTQFEKGTTRPCFTSTVLTPDVNAADDHVIKWTASSVAAGGFSTRLSFLQVFFLTMALYPDAQQKAQAEIDDVIGHGRFPTFADRDSLPYINALCREVLRFHSVVPTGLPHVVMENDIHGGYFIPKGSIIIANTWNMLHDPQTYADPDTFNPSRFICCSGHEAERDIYDFVFGFGRRKRRTKRPKLYTGRVLADTSLFIMAAMSLAVFHISKHLDANGEVVEPVLKPLSGSVSQPTPFQCSIRVRSPEALSLLMSGGEQAD